MSYYMSSPPTRVDPDLLSQITRIRKTFGAPSISCGVLHNGEIRFYHGDGLADVETNMPPNIDTIYSIASCSKAFVTATCGILAREEKLSWNDTISKHLPEFKTVNDPEVGRRATLVDLCSHGTGLAPLDHAGCGFHDHYVNSGQHQVHIASNLPVAYDLRSQFLYNNFMLGLVGDVIAKVTGQTAGTAVKERIFTPLGMKRSVTSAAEYPDGNVARGYSILNDGSSVPLPDPDLRDTGLQGASGFVRSSVGDMLTWAKAVMEAEDTLDPSECHPALRDIAFTRAARRPIVVDGGSFENSYGLGWFRHMLPSPWLGSIGPNFSLLADDPPVIGKKSPSRLAIAHWGEFAGFLTSFYTFPETKSAIIVMANCSPSRGDPTDLIAQALCQHLFDLKPQLDLAAYAERAMLRASDNWVDLTREWKVNRRLGTPLQPLSEYVGCYTNKGLDLRLDLFELSPNAEIDEADPDLLGMRINCMEDQFARLRHYHFDVWTFLPKSRDDAIRDGLEGFMALPMLLLSFTRDARGVVNDLKWDLQAGQCEGPAPGIEHLVEPVVFQRL